MQKIEEIDIIILQKAKRIRKSGVLSRSVTTREYAEFPSLHITTVVTGKLKQICWAYHTIPGKVPELTVFCGNTRCIPETRFFAN